VALAVAGVAAAIVWPSLAFAASFNPTYNPNAVSVGTGTSILVPCGSTTVAGTGYQPNEFVSLILEPGSVSLGTAATETTGSFSTTATIPPGTHPGTYTLVSAGGTGYSAVTDLTVGKGGCRSALLLLSHSTIVPGESTVATGWGCDPGQQVFLTIAGDQVGRAIADSQGMFSVPITPPGSGARDMTVLASCGSRTFGVLLSVVASSAVSTPEGVTAVFGVFVLLGLVLLWGEFGSSASRRRRKQRRA